MLEERAIVTAVNLDKVTVQSEVKSTCSSCQQNETCGSGIVAKAIPQKKLTVELVTPFDLTVGDVVTISIPEKDLLQTAWQVYLWPILGLVAFSALGQYLVTQLIFPHEIFAVVLGCLGGYLAFKFTGFWQIKSGLSLKLLPKIMHVELKTIPLTEV